MVGAECLSDLAACCSHDERLLGVVLSTRSVANRSCFPSVQYTSEASERETAIDDDGLAIDHGGSNTQKHNHVRNVLRRAGALQKGAVD